MSARDTGECAKVVVRCTIVSPDGEWFYGENDCFTPQATCPRAPGEGYEKCASVCGQTAHAEINALKYAGSKAKGAAVFIEGHTRVCEPCEAALRAAGVRWWTFAPPPKVVPAHSHTSASQLVYAYANRDQTYEKLAALLRCDMPSIMMEWASGSQLFTLRSTDARASELAVTLLTEKLIEHETDVITLGGRLPAFEQDN